MFGTSSQNASVVKAGNIVAANFKDAQSADQCAGLQLAVWEAIEDGGDQPDFLGGHFQAGANPSVMAYAQQYYQAAGQKGNALFLRAFGGQTQIVPSDPN